MPLPPSERQMRAGKTLLQTSIPNQPQLGKVFALKAKYP